MRTSIFLALALLAATAGPASAAGQQDDIDTCLACHGETDLAVTLPSGETRSLYVDKAVFAASIHGGRLGCRDCHTGMDEVPHPTRSFQTRREFTLAYYEACKRCHFANYSKTLDSVHYTALARGDRSAPICVDCHGSHDITRPNQPRSRISQTCAACHEGVSVTYAKSVHGRALKETNNVDVPTCTDCHHSHDISGPHNATWRLSSPELCAGCHTNRKVMDKYGLSTGVMQTYLADFHGMTAKLQKAQGANGSSVTALCVDCHGVHDITKTDGANANVMQANLLRTCQRCHAGATKNFSAAWLSHYEPSLKRTPLIYGVKVFYLVIIPFVIGGLILQILLHLWRVVVNR